MGKKKQYFMYGTIVSYQSYLDMKTLYVVEDIFNENSEIQGIFTGRDAEFIIVGKVLESIEGDTHAVPELNEAQELVLRGLINHKYGIRGEYHYYFVKK